MEKIVLSLILLACLLVVFGIVKEKNKHLSLEDDPNLSVPTSLDKDGVIYLNSSIKGVKKTFSVKTDEMSAVWFANQSRQVRRKITDDLLSGKTAIINGFKFDLGNE